MNKFIAILFSVCFSMSAIADMKINSVFVYSNDLGYESSGYGLQLDADNRHGDWGYDLEATILKHAKLDASGQRHQIIAMGRRFFGAMFVEAGLEYGGYNSKFPNGRTWKKYGAAPGIGVGYMHNNSEWNLRYFFPDSTVNETSVFSIGFDIPLRKSWTAGAALEVWNFDQSGERLTGNQITLTLGYRF